jgi:hypothetical protein
MSCLGMVSWGGDPFSSGSTRASHAYTICDGLDVKLIACAAYRR